MQALCEKLENAYRMVRVNLGKAAQSRKEKHDFFIKPHSFQVGDLVYYYYPRRRPGLKVKWMSFGMVHIEYYLG